MTPSGRAKGAADTTEYQRHGMTCGAFENLTLPIRLSFHTNLMLEQNPALAAGLESRSGVSD